MILLLLLQLLGLPDRRQLYMETRDTWQASPARVQYDTLVGWISRPNLATPFVNAEFKTTVRTDGEGFRMNPYPTRSRIVLVGDSFTFGWGVNDNETAAYWLGAYNVSCPGWNTWQQLAALRRWREKHDPRHELVYVLLWNETDRRENEWLTGTPTFQSEAQFVELQDYLGHRKSLGAWAAVQATLKYWRPSILMRDPVGMFEEEFGGIVIELPTLSEVESGKPLSLPFKAEDYFPLDGHLTPAGQRQLADFVGQVLHGM